MENDEDGDILPKDLKELTGLSNATAEAIAACKAHLESERRGMLKQELIQKHRAEEAMYKLQCSNFQKQSKRPRRRKPRAPRPQSLPAILDGRYAAKDGMRVHGRRKIKNIAGRLGEVMPLDDDEDYHYERPKDDGDSDPPVSARHAEYGGGKFALPDI